MREHRYKRYMLAVLLSFMAFSFVDRMGLGLMLQNIKADLDLSDTQLGLLGGVAFAFFYSVMGLPIARWADRGNRVTILTLAVTLWSAIVAMCGLATSFVQLLLLRVGVSVGEAGCTPTAHSLIADHFTRAERPRAAAVYALGGPLSYLIGYFAAGWLNERYGWRATFAFLALPGVPLALLARFTLKEPRVVRGLSGQSHSVSAADRIHAAPGFMAVCKFLWGLRTFPHILLGFSAVFFFAYGILQWQPAYFIRRYGMGTGQLGTWFAIIFGCGGLLGTYIGGVLAHRFGVHRESEQLRAISVVLLFSGCLSVLVYVVPSSNHAFYLLAVFAIAFNSIAGPLFAILQSLVPADMRATTIAIVYLFSNLFGMGLGPVAVGALSDLFQHRYGDESLRYVLLLMSPGFAYAALHTWRASRTVMEDLDAVPAGIADETDGIAATPRPAG